MARKSGWQEFTENFNSVYGTFKQVGQDVETGRIMDDEKFMAEGGLGYNSKTGKALEGTALEKARYKALGDIATKYGNAKDGLEYRQQLSNLESSERENTINQSIMAELINQRGALTSQTMRSQIRNTDADTGRLGSVTANNRQTLAENKATFDTRLRSLVAKAGLDEANTTIAEVKAAIAKGTQSQEQKALLAEIEKRRIVAEADGANFNTVADLNIDKLRADIAGTKAGTQLTGAQEDRTEALTAKQGFENARQEAFKLKDYAAYGESLDADLEAAKARGDQSSLAALTAQRAELRELALMDFHTFVPETDEETYGTADDQRYDQWLGMIKTFDGPQAALAWRNNHSAETTGLILADSNRLKAEVDRAYKPDGGGTRQVAKMMDGINGDDTGADVIKLPDGRMALVETNADGSVYRVVAAAETETQLGKIVQTMAGPEGAIKVADVLHQTKTRKLDLEKAEQEIETAKAGQALKAAQGRLATAQIKSVDFNNKLTKQQTKQISEKITDIIADRQGISRKDKQTLVIKELAKFLTFNLDATDDEIFAFVSQLGGASDQVSEEFAEFEIVQ